MAVDPVYLWDDFVGEWVPAASLLASEILSEYTPPAPPEEVATNNTSDHATDDTSYSLSPPRPPRRTRVALKGHSAARAPIIASLLLAVHGGHGATMTQCTDTIVVIHVTNARLFMQWIARHNTKASPTQSIVARRKALARWFTGIPSLGSRIAKCPPFYMTATNTDQVVPNAARKLIQLAAEMGLVF